jgi:hypothetical protein
MRTAYRIAVCKTKRRIEEDNIKVGLKEIGRVVLDCIHVSDKVQ